MTLKINITAPNIKFNAKQGAMLMNIFISLLLIWFSLSPPRFAQMLLERLNYLAYDIRMNLHLQPDAHPKNPVIIVDIDEKSLQQEGRWPWSREKLAHLVNSLYQQGIAVLAFDMLFPEPEKDKDAVFAKAIGQEKDKAVLGMFFSAQKYPSAGVIPPGLIEIDFPNFDMPAMQTYTANIAVLTQAANYHAGALSIMPDTDSVIRYYSLLQRYKNALYPSLALEAVRLYLLENHLSIETSLLGSKIVIDAVKLGNKRIATDGQGRVLIPYLGASHSFTYYSATDVLHHLVPPEKLKNTLVFLGTSATGLGDTRSTPVESVFPGVEIHANAAEGLLNNAFLYAPSWIPGMQLSLLIFLAVFLSIIFTRTGALWIILISAGVITLIFFASLWLWQYALIVYPIVMPIFLVGILAVFNMTYGYLRESRQRNTLKKIFEQYVPSGHIEKILKNPKSGDVLEGERKSMSVLFMDIRDFTRLSENLTITDLRKLLNFFLTEMTTIIFNHGGTVDKYVGDMIIAFWGAPLNDEAHAKHAMSAGLAMLDAIQPLQKKLQNMGLPSVKIGIGINTGIMDAGDMGSAYRRAYTVLGDAVNLASRLESLTKYYGVDILCGENSILNQDDFIFRLVDKVRVKGKHTAIQIYEVLGLRKNMSTVQLKLLEESLTTYHQALQAYFSKNFAQSYKLFLNLCQQFPETDLYQLYLSRLENLVKSPPPAEWDGIWEHHEK